MPANSGRFSGKQFQLRSGRRAANAILDFALPRVCVLCQRLMDEQPELVCQLCIADLPRLPDPRCHRCGHPVYDGDCQWCPLLPPFVVFARSACWVPEGVGGAMVHHLKYGGWTGVAPTMAAVLEQHLTPSIDNTGAVVVPVPLSAARMRERGYNQSAVLAHALAARWHLRVADHAIVRQRETESQVRLTPGERSANVHGAFAAGPAVSAVRGRHVVLIDDVVTTAATLNACAATTVAAGAHSLSYVTFGRARAAFDRRAHPRRETRWLSASASTASAALAAKSFAPRKSGESPI